MDAYPILEEIAEAMAKVKLEAILIGNAAAALHGAPVTTIDFDFFYMTSADNINKLLTLSKLLDGKISQPITDSTMYRIECPDGIQFDFLDQIDGVDSFANLRFEVQQVYFGSGSILVASLKDVIKSKEACGRLIDLAVIDLLKLTLEEINNPGQKSENKLELNSKNNVNLSDEEKRILREEMSREENLHQIRKLLSSPINKRTNFLRKKLPNGGSCL